MVQEDSLAMAVHRFARELGIDICLAFDPKLLVPEKRIRDLCSENKCGNYGNHYMCPPHVGTLEEHVAKLRRFRRGVLLQYVRRLNVHEDRAGVRRAKSELHHKILALEGLVKESGGGVVCGLIGGDCGLCLPCKAQLDEPCPYPDKARPSLESLAIDVLGLLDRHGLDNEFHPDKITWTGCLLF